MSQLTDRVFHDFQYHPANKRTGPMHDRVRAMCFDLAEFLVHEVPLGRERSLALTRLEEAMFWANAGIARANYDSNTEVLGNEIAAALDPAE